MNDEDVESVVGTESADIENIPCGTHAVKRFYAERVGVEQLEGKGVIEECYVDAPDVGAVGDDIFVARLLE